VRAEALLLRRAEITAGMLELGAARAELERLDGLRDRYEELQRRREELSALFKEARNELRQRLTSREVRLESLSARGARREALTGELAALAVALDALAPLAQELELRADEAAALAQRAAQLDELSRRRDGLIATIKLRKDSLVAARETRREAAERLERQLADAARWRADRETARADQQALAASEAQLAELRAREQVELDRVSAGRAACQTAQAEAEKLKRNKALLDEGSGSCPVCGSPLGVDGLVEVHRHYDTELAGLRIGYAEARNAADQGETQLEATRAAIAEGEQALGALRRSAARLEALERQLEQAAAWEREVAQIRGALDDLRAQIEGEEFEPAAQAELRAVQEELALLGDPVELVQRRAIVDERVRELQRRLQERGQIAGRQEAYGEELHQIEAELAELPALQAELAELRRTLEANDFAHAVRDEGQAMRAAIEALGYSVEAHAAVRERARELRRWEEDDRALAVAEQGYTRDKTILEQAEALHVRDAAEIGRLEGAEARLADELRELPRASALADEAAHAVRERQQQLQVAQRDLGEKQGYLRRAQSDADVLARREEEERATSERHGLYAELAEAFGKKGVQAMLIDTAIPQIEDEANRLLARMTDGQMHLSLDTQRDTKKGDTVETLEIRIADPLGTRAYDAFSGGEAMRVNFAVRIALSRLLARRAGARLETLVIDEGFGTLDALGRERMVEAITSVQGDFKRIIVITHLDELKDRFPATIEVTKTALGSRWEIR
jgi:exonuclease SbcC